MDVKFFEFRIVESCIRHTYITRAIVHDRIKIYSANIYIYGMKNRSFPSYSRNREIFFIGIAHQLSAVSRAISRFLNIIRNGDKVVSGNVIPVSPSIIPLYLMGKSNYNVSYRRKYGNENRETKGSHGLKL